MVSKYWNKEDKDRNIRLPSPAEGERDALEQEWLGQHEILDYRNWLQAELLKARKHPPVRTRSDPEYHEAVQALINCGPVIDQPTDSDLKHAPVRESFDQLTRDRFSGEHNRPDCEVCCHCFSCKKEFVPPTVEELRDAHYTIGEPPNLLDFADAFHQSQIRCQECRK